MNNSITTSKQCPKCGGLQTGRYHCKPCDNLWHKQNPRSNEQEMLLSARKRAKASGQACTITVYDIDIPKFCPLLGVELQRAQGLGAYNPNAPSLDKLDPAKGYVYGNVWVISRKANSIKHTATWEEIARVAENLRIKVGGTVPIKPVDPTDLIAFRRARHTANTRKLRAAKKALLVNQSLPGGMPKGFKWNGASLTILNQRREHGVHTGEGPSTGSKD